MLGLCALIAPCHRLESLPIVPKYLGRYPGIYKVSDSDFFARLLIPTVIFSRSGCLTAFSAKIGTPQRETNPRLGLFADVVDPLAPCVFIGVD